MADNRITRWISLMLDKEAARKAEADAQASLKRSFNLSGPASSFSKFFTDVTRLAAEAAATIAGYIATIAKLDERGGQVLTVQKAFGNAFGDSAEGVEKLRKATQGLITDYDLMQMANKSFLLGASKNTDQVAELASVGVQLGRALGIDATTAVNVLSEGIGKQQRRILTSIGLYIQASDAYENYGLKIGKTQKEMTVEDRQNAFRIATLEAAKKKIEEVGGAEGTLADNLTRASKAWGNLKDAASKFVASSPLVGTTFFEAGKVLNDLRDALNSGDADNIKTAVELFGELLGELFVSGLLKGVANITESAKFKNNALLGALASGTAGAVVGLKTGGWPGALTGFAIGAAAAEPAARGLTKVLNDGAEAANSLADNTMTALNNIGKASQHVETLAEKTARLKKEEASAALQKKIAAEQADEEIAKARQVEDDRLKDLTKGAGLHKLTKDEVKETFGILVESSRLINNGIPDLKERTRQYERQAEAIKILGGIERKPMVAEPLGAGHGTVGIGPDGQPLGHALSGAGEGFGTGGVGKGASVPGLGVEGIESLALPRGLTGVEDPLQLLTGTSGITFPKALDSIQNHLKDWAKKQPLSDFGKVFLDNFDTIESAAETTAQGILESFTSAFSAISEKHKAMAELDAQYQIKISEAHSAAERQRVNQWYAIEKSNVNRMHGLWDALAIGFASSVLKGIAQAAGAEVGVNMAKAAGAIGDGLLSGKPTDWAAVGAYLKSAALWAAAGGIASAGIAGLGASTNSYQGTPIVGSSTDNNVSSTNGPEIHLHIDGIDPNNPKHQVQLGKTIREYQQRYGSKIVVNG